MDSIVERPPIDVLRVRADMRGSGPKAAFEKLEAKLPALKGRKFFGVVRILDAGEEYYACVERLPTENSTAMGIESGTIPGGRYLRRRVWDWQSVVREGKMKEISQAFAREYSLDPDRPSIEYYRSTQELHLLLPLAASNQDPRP